VSNAFFSAQIATTTQWFIAICSSDEDLLIMRSLVPEGKEAGRSIGAPTTEGRQSLDDISHRNAVQQLSKRLASRVSIESSQHQSLSVVFNNAMRKGNKSREKVSFVHEDNVKLPEDVVVNVIEALDPTAGNPPLVMGDHIVLLAIPSVMRMLENENAHPNARVPCREGQQTGRFARKHRPQDQCEGH
jgi:hypothetical protein